MKEFEFRYYKREELEINSIDSRLNKEEKEVRRFLMNYTIDNDKPYNLKDDLGLAADKMEKSNQELSDLFNILIGKGVIVVGEDSNINYIYPISSMKTNHKVKLADGRSFNSMCAIDSIGSAFTFKQDVEIKSVCSDTGKPISIKIVDEKFEEVSPIDMEILHVDLKNNDNWSGSC